STVVRGSLDAAVTAIQSGTLSGDGTVVGNIQNTGGFVNPFAAGSPATLTGTVDFTTVNGFTPLPGDSFTFMDFASSTGNFSSMDLTNWACPTTCTDV